MTQGAAITLDQVAYRYAGTGPVLAPTSCRIEAGEMVALLGPSGCGKSTLLRLLAALDAPQEGRLAVDAGTRAHFRAFVFQDATLVPWRDVARNVALPLELMRVPKAEARAKALDALRRVGLADAAERHPGQLSGGMRMRVSVARALVTEPALLLLDEPFAALDEQTRHALQDELYRIWRAARMTVVFVTHSVAEACYLASRVLVLSPRPARVLLDRKSELGDERGLRLRTDPRYMREMQAVYAALGGEGASHGKGEPV